MISLVRFVRACTLELLPFMYALLFDFSLPLFLSPALYSIFSFCHWAYTHNINARSHAQTQSTESDITCKSLRNVAHAHSSALHPHKLSPSLFLSQIHTSLEEFNFRSLTKLLLVRRASIVRRLILCSRRILLLTCGARLLIALLMVRLFRTTATTAVILNVSRSRPMRLVNSVWLLHTRARINCGYLWDFFWSKTIEIYCLRLWLRSLVVMQRIARTYAGGSEPKRC